MYEKNSLSTEHATEKIVLHFSDKPSSLVKYKIVCPLKFYMRGVKAKNPTFVGYTVDDGPLIIFQ